MEKIKMNKITKIIIATAMCANWVWAGINEDYSAALAMGKTKQYDKAKVAFEQILATYPDGDINVLAWTTYRLASVMRARGGMTTESLEMYLKLISDYPTADLDLLAQARLQIGNTLLGTGKYIEAVLQFDTVISNYPTAKVLTLATAQQNIGSALVKQRKYAEAVIAFAKVEDYPDAPPELLAMNQLSIGGAYVAQGKNVEAQASFVKAATSYGFINVAWQQSVYTKINFKILGTEGTKAYLNDLLLVVPTVEANSEFLSVVKSQLEILK
jgi:TolA-binding protein